MAQTLAKRPFAGYWEYYLDSALFSAPAHPRWGGAACIGPGGRLQIQDRWAGSLHRFAWVATADPAPR